MLGAPCSGERYRVLHLTWVAVFLTFVVWFNFAPLAPPAAASLGLTGDQLTTLALANVALTVPARALIGMALDGRGPRRVFAGILIYATVPTLVFATATTFTTLLVGRLASSEVGAGFVVGIHIMAEWSPLGTGGGRGPVRRLGQLPRGGAPGRGAGGPGIR